MNREHEKLEIISRYYEIKNKLNLLEQSIRMINSSSRTGYKMNIEYNRLMNNYQSLKEDSNTLLRRLFVIDPNNARLKDLGIYDNNNLINSSSISVGKRKKKRSSSRLQPNKKPRKKPRKKSIRKSKQKLK
jgi:hypothetical protein